jgi:hypothetical protein
MPYGSNIARLQALKGNFGDERISTAPGTLYFALLRHASNPTTILGTEPDSTGGYARVAMFNDDTEWTFGVNSVSNTDEIRWPMATELYSITDALNQWAIYDNNSTGVCIAFGVLSTTITITGPGDTPAISSGSLTITELA